MRRIFALTLLLCMAFTMYLNDVTSIILKLIVKRVRALRRKGFLTPFKVFKSIKASNRVRILQGEVYADCIYFFPLKVHISFKLIDVKDISLEKKFMVIFQAI